MTILVPPLLSPLNGMGLPPITIILPLGSRCETFPRGPYIARIIMTGLAMRVLLRRVIVSNDDGGAPA